MSYDASLSLTYNEETVNCANSLPAIIDSHASPFSRKFLTRQNIDNNMYSIDLRQSSIMITQLQQDMHDWLISLQKIYHVCIF